jgi:hypothetical protein
MHCCVTRTAPPQVEEERPIRLEPVGLDRRHNRYWRFGLGAAMGDAAALAAFGPDLLQGDPSLGRLFIESGGPDRWAGEGFRYMVVHRVCGLLLHVHRPALLELHSCRCHVCLCLNPYVLCALRLCCSSSWQLLSQAEQLDQLSAVLEPRGIREVSGWPGVLRSNTYLIRCCQVLSNINYASRNCEISLSTATCIFHPSNDWMLAPSPFSSRRAT